MTVPAVLSRQVDVSTGDLTTLIAAKSRDLDVKAIVPASASTGIAGEDYGALIVHSSSGITSPKELEGKSSHPTSSPTSLLPLPAKRSPPMEAT